MGKALFLSSSTQYSKEWDEEVEEPETLGVGGGVEIISSDGVVSYPLHAIGEPAFLIADKKLWAWNGLLHRTDGAAHEYLVGDEWCEQFWVFGINIGSEELAKHKDAFQAIQNFLESNDILVGEFCGYDTWCKIETIEELLEAATTGKITLVSGPRDQQTIKTVDYRATMSKAVPLLAAAGILGTLGVLAKAKVAERKQQQQKQLQGVQTP